MDGVNVKRLVVAWIVPASAIGAGFMIWALSLLALLGGWDCAGVECWPAPDVWLRMILAGFGGGLIFQLVYGGLAFFLLTLAGIWTYRTAVLAYVLPVLLLSLYWNHESRDIVIGTIPWLVIAVIAAHMTWARVR
jgi:hypothetical protein